MEIKLDVFITLPQVYGDQTGCFYNTTTSLWSTQPVFHFWLKIVMRDGVKIARGIVIIGVHYSHRLGGFSLCTKVLIIRVCVFIILVG